MDDDDAKKGPAFLSEEFVREATATLAESGFVTDEHAFAPYRETMSKNVSAIEAALRNHGLEISLASGFLADHPTAGYAYYVYDADRFASAGQAAAAVSEWLDRRYGREADDA